MNPEKIDFKDDYQDTITMIETRSEYRRIPSKEKKYMTAAEMGRLLGVKRNTVYSILKNPQYKDIFEIVIVADRKKITRDSFERFLVSQEKYTLDKVNQYKEISMEENIALADYRRKKLRNN